MTAIVKAKPRQRTRTATGPHANVGPLMGGATFTTDVVKLIASDIAAAVAHHIETMYPTAITGASRSLLRSVRGSIFNEIMASLKTHDVPSIMARLRKRAAHRHALAAAYRKIRTPKDGPAQVHAALDKLGREHE